MAMLSKKRLPSGGTPPPPPPATALIKGLVPVVVVPAGVNGVAPAMGVDAVARGPTTVEGDRPVVTVAPGEGGTPLFRLTSPCVYCASKVCACGNSSLQAMLRWIWAWRI